MGAGSNAAIAAAASQAIAATQQVCMFNDIITLEILIVLLLYALTKEFTVFQNADRTTKISVHA